jgi:hypothetical protein
LWPSPATRHGACAAAAKARPAEQCRAAQFGAQEPGSCEVIANFAAKKGAKFRMMDKVRRR